MKQPALLLLAALGILPSATVLAVTPDDPPKCQECQHLCALMDQMLQKEATAGFYWEFALKNPNARHAASADEVYHQVKDVDFDNWGKTRPWPCFEPRGGPGPTQADLETTDSTANPPCVILMDIYGPNGTLLEQKELYKGDAYQRFTEGKCSDIYLPTIKHEEKHQQDCKAAKAMGQSLYDVPARWAQSEFEANSLHAQILRQEIRQLINSSPSGCGWQPTDRQKKDPKSIPSVKQMQRMEQIRHFFEMAFGPGD